MEPLQLFLDNFLANPAFFTGGLVFVGLLLVKKPYYEAVAGFIKTAIGYYILMTGSNGLTNTLKPVIQAFGERFDMEAAAADYSINWAQANSASGIYAIEGAAGWTMIAFVVAMVWNILLVKMNRYTKCRTIYTTGHIMQAYSMTWLWMCFLVAPSTRNLYFALIFGVLIGTWASVASNMTVEAVRNLTGGENLAVGHQQMVMILLTNKLAGKLGKEEDGLEKIKLPGFLSVFQDSYVSTTIIMFLFLGGVMLFIGEETLRKMGILEENTLFFVYILTQCIYLSVFLCILQTGVKMFVSELIHAFEGISAKLLKGSLPAVDCTVMLQYVHSNVPMVGFISGFLGQLTAIIGLLIFQSPVFLIPGFVPLFFDNGLIAVFANKRGGRRAAVIVPFFNGILQILTSLVMLLFIRRMSGQMISAWPAMSDTNFFLSPLLVGITVLPPVFVAAVIILILLLLNQLYYRRNKDGYY